MGNIYTALKLHYRSFFVSTASKKGELRELFTYRQVATPSSNSIRLAWLCEAIIGELPVFDCWLQALLEELSKATHLRADPSLADRYRLIFGPVFFQKVALYYGVDEAWQESHVRDVMFCVIIICYNYANSLEAHCENYEWRLDELVDVIHDIMLEKNVDLCEFIWCDIDFHAIFLYARHLIDPLACGMTY